MFWLIWHKCQKVYIIINCPLCVISIVLYHCLGLWTVRQATGLIISCFAHFATIFPFHYNCLSCLSCLWLIIEPSYFKQMCIDARSKSLNSQIFGHFSICYTCYLCYIDLTCYPDIILYINLPNAK